MELFTLIGVVSVLYLMLLFFDSVFKVIFVLNDELQKHKISERKIS